MSPAKAKKDVDTSASEERTVDLYNANDGVHGRDGGPYLDEVEAQHWEKIHAAREGSEPDLENPRPYPGILLRTKHQQVTEFNPTLIVGDDRRDSSNFQAKPYATDVPVVESVLADFSVSDDDRGNEELPVPDPPLSDNPVENNVGPVE